MDPIRAEIKAYHVDEERRAELQATLERRAEEIYQDLPAFLGTDLLLETVSELADNDPAFDLMTYTAYMATRKANTAAAHEDLGRKVAGWIEYYLRKSAICQAEEELGL